MFDHFSKPTYYSFINVATIWTRLYVGLSPHEFGPKIYIIEFAAQSLEDPKSEPVAVYYHAGTVHYLWRNRCWCECDLYAPYLEERTKELLQREQDQNKILNFHKLLDMLKLYHKRTWIVGSLADIPISGQHYTAIIYPINA